MIYLWFPGFQEDSYEIDTTPIDAPWDDRDWPLDTVRNKIQMKNPDWVSDIQRVYNVIMKRSMNGVIRTYIKRDRANMEEYEITLSFKDIRYERRLAMEHFLLCAEGKYVGYRDPDGFDHVCKLLPGEWQFTAVGRAAGVGQDGDTCEDEHHTFDIRLRIVRNAT